MTEEDYNEACDLKMRVMNLESFIKKLDINYSNLEDCNDAEYIEVKNFKRMLKQARSKMKELKIKFNKL